MNNKHGGRGHDHAHGHSHGHDHHHDHAPSSLKALLTVLIFTTVIFFVEVVGGLWSGSLALLSDAMHMLGDSTGLIVAAVAVALGRRGRTLTATYGYKRFEILATVVNAAAVSAISVWIVVEAIARLRSGEQVDTLMMLVVGAIGLVANVFGAVVLHGHREEGMNIEGAFLHVLVDLFGSVAVIAAALIMRWTPITWADTAASLVIAALILPRAIKLLVQSVNVLLERTPEGIDVETMEKELSTIPGVVSVHDLHVWSLDGMQLLATCHVVVDQRNCDIYECGVLDVAQQVLRDNGIEHSTIQLESAAHHSHETHCGAVTEVGEVA
ncbi:cation diffusion facilitator family transporter [Corynebacterium vitaeruminis]|uniref:cation diffusion facilitator family transporter n=1 Tax=Corynebacterium vitaeruminis TaxID=38305 RepID=UPI0023F401B0|nr:cation diffusion facilitator family transporter [Corynebacterium vitaeruminis]